VFRHPHIFGENAPALVLSPSDPREGNGSFNH
jgi:hypothetical protein